MARTGENIYKRKDGRWEGRTIISYEKNGKAKYKYVYARTYNEVKSKLLYAATLAECNSIKKSNYENCKYEYILDNWLYAKRVNIKSSTYIRYRNSIENHIKPKLGKYHIEKIDTALMESFILELLLSGRVDSKGGLSSKTVSDILVIIKDSFAYARNKGLSPNCNFENITVRRQSHEMRVLSCSEMESLLNTLLSNTDLCKLGVLLCLFTGIRIGELCALRWGNISIADKFIKVESTMQRLQNNDIDAFTKTQIIITEPKSCASVRIIPLPDFLLTLIVPYYKKENSFFLTGESKKYIEPRIMQNRFKGYIKDSGIKDANFHSLRHTFATRCIESGFDVKTLSEILGHSSVKITLDKYVHCSMEQKRLNMDKLQVHF